MTSMPTPEPSAGPPIDRVAIVGTGLIGTSIAMAAARAGCTVRGWDADPDVAARAAARSALEDAPTLEDAVRDADLVIVCTPIEALAGSIVSALRAAPGATVTDAGGFRDLTRLAASNPALWTEILLANRDQITAAIDLYVDRLRDLRDEVAAGRAPEVERTFEDAKRARLRLATKPTIRAGVAVLQVEIPDEPGALARITAVLADGAVNIEDLQIVHSPEGGRGTVHMTVAAAVAPDAANVLR